MFGKGNNGGGNPNHAKDGKFASKDGTYTGQSASNIKQKKQREEMKAHAKEVYASPEFKEKIERLSAEMFKNDPHFEALSKSEDFSNVLKKSGMSTRTMHLILKKYKNIDEFIKDATENPDFNLPGDKSTKEAKIFADSYKKTNSESPKKEQSSKKRWYVANNTNGNLLDEEPIYADTEEEAYKIAEQKHGRLGDELAVVEDEEEQEEDIAPEDEAKKAGELYNMDFSDNMPENYSPMNEFSGPEDSDESYAQIEAKKQAEDNDYIDKPSFASRKITLDDGSTIGGKRNISNEDVIEFFQDQGIELTDEDKKMINNYTIPTRLLKELGLESEDDLAEAFAEYWEDLPDDDWEPVW